LPLVSIVEGPSAEELISVVLRLFEESLATEGSALEPRPKPTPDAGSLLAQIDEFSDDDVDALLRRMLAEKGT
jgi:hypothetical protein